MAKSFTTDDLAEAKQRADAEFKQTGFKWIILYSDWPFKEKTDTDPNRTDNKHYIVCPIHQENRSFTGRDWKQIYVTEDPSEGKTYHDGFDEGYAMGLADGKAENDNEIR